MNNPSGQITSQQVFDYFCIFQHISPIILVFLIRFLNFQNKIIKNKFPVDLRDFCVCRCNFSRFWAIFIFFQSLFHNFGDFNLTHNFCYYPEINFQSDMIQDINIKTMKMIERVFVIFLQKSIINFNKCSLNLFLAFLFMF